MGCARTGGCLVALLLISCGSDGASRSGPALEPRPDVQTCLPDVSEGMPARLSDTGCFADLKTLEPGPDLIPYEVNSALWTDGAFKPRYMVVPSPEQIAIQEDGSWVFPDGSVLIKVFGFEFDVGDPQSRRAVETRFMVRNGAALGVLDLPVERRGHGGRASRCAQDRRIHDSGRGEARSSSTCSRSTTTASPATDRRSTTCSARRRRRSTATATTTGW